MGQKEEIETSMAYNADETLIASELKKILEQELPATTSKEEKELYEEIERRIALENEKLFAEKAGSRKKGHIGLPVKAKLLAASNLAKSRAELKARKQEALAKAAIDKAEESSRVSKMGEDVSRKYKTSHDSLRKHLAEEGVHRKFHNSDSDSSDFEEAGTAEYSPMNKLRRSIRKAKALSRFEKMGITVQKEEEKEDSDEGIRAVREESEAWLKKQKDLEKQLMAKASKGALKQRYMSKGAETHEDVPATEKRIDELLERVIKDSNLKIKGRAGFSKSYDRRLEGGYSKPKTDMADIVKRALALRQEVEAAGTKDKTKAARKTAKKPFPVKLETSSSDSEPSESVSSSDHDDVSDTSVKRFDMPELDSISESSEDDDEKLEKYRKRSRPKFDFCKQSSFDLTEVDDVMAMEEAKRKLGKKPELWSSKPPGYKKYEPRQVEKKSSDTSLKSKPKLIDTFPPEVEALRAKLALGDFGMSNREFLNSDKFLNSKKEIPTKVKPPPTLMGKEPSKNETTTKTGIKDLRPNQVSNLTKKAPLKTTRTLRELSEPDPVKKMVERNKSVEGKSKLVDMKRRPSVGSGRTPSKFI